MSFQQFADIIQEHLDKEQSIKEGLWHEGPALIYALQGKYPVNRGYRQISRDAHQLARKRGEKGISITYISRCYRRKEIMCKRVFLLLNALLNEYYKLERLATQANKGVSTS